MKTLCYPLILCALTLLLFSTNSFSQTERTVTLVCNTDNINRVEPHTVCYFVGQAEGTDSRNYTIEAEVGDTILWKGLTLSDDSLYIKKIKYEKGTNVFDKDSLVGASNVIGIIKYNTKDKPDYKYKISFKVNDKGKMLSIDPLIKVIGQ